MRLKKGFTLAEILIVLMVIGALATMTIPSLMKGVTEAQFKTGYRKALNALINLTVMEKLSGNLPSTTSAEGAGKLFDILSASLSVKAYVPLSKNTLATAGTGTTVSVDDYDTARPSDTKDAQNNTVSRAQNWIVTEDNFAYLVAQTSNTTKCETKIELNATQGKITSEESSAAKLTSGKTNDTLASKACYVIYVDVNGLSSGPNTVIQNTILSTKKVPAITDDTFPVYVALDGATSGNQKTTITGRIAADLK